MMGEGMPNMEHEIDNQINSQTDGEGITRREVLRAGGVAGAAAALGVSAIGAAKSDMTPAIIPAPEVTVPKVKLGKTGMMVSRLALGGSWDIDHEVLALAFSLGINYIDTAESYRGGQSEKLC